MSTTRIGFASVAGRTPAADGPLGAARAHEPAEPRPLTTGTKVALAAGGVALVAGGAWYGGSYARAGGRGAVVGAVAAAFVAATLIGATTTYLTQGHGALARH